MRAAPLLALFLAAPVAASTSYDLRPLAAVAPEFAPLQQAIDRRDNAMAARLAVKLAAHSTVTEVRQAAWYVHNRSCLDPRSKRCRQIPAKAASELSRPFQHQLLHARSRKAIRKRQLPQAWALLQTASSDYVETNRLLLAVAERSDADVWSDAHTARFTAIEPALSRRQRCRMLLLLGDKSIDAAGKWAAYRQVWSGACKGMRGEALERLIAAGMTPSPLERIDWLVSRRLPRRGRARKKAERLVLRDVERAATGISGLATYGRAALYARSRSRREKALKLYSEAIAQAQDADVLASAQYGQADLLGILNRDKEAIAKLEPLLLVQLPPEELARIRWRLFRLYRAEKQWLDAERVLNELASSRNPWRDEALWALAWRRLRLDDLEEASRLLARLRSLIAPDADDGKQPWHARIDYWRARCAARLGRKDEAIAWYSAVARRHPHTYYGMIALDRLAGLDPDKAAALSPPSLSGGDAPLALEQLTVQRHPMLDGPVLLLRIGALAAARDMLRGIVASRLPRDGVHLLAALYHETGRPRAAFALLRRHARRAAAPDASSASVWRVAYATPFLEEFTTAADAAGVPRSLLYAVARHESHFVPTARSAAGAMGLVQLLPMVARRITELYGLRKRRARYLLRPSHNLAIGGRYLAQLDSFLRGNHAMVLAAYNAGPYAVRRWWNETGAVDTDVFVESIPYGQARNYARGVLATARAYALLHPEWAERGRLAAGRHRRVPGELGPFMVPPQDPAKAAALQPIGGGARSLAAPLR